MPDRANIPEINRSDDGGKIGNTLPIAIRVYPEPEGKERKPGKLGKWRLPKGMFVFDTETRTDATQALTFGSYRIIVEGKSIEENLFCDDDLPDTDRRILQEYVEHHRADTASGGNRELALLTRSEFVDKLFRAAYKSRYLLVAFNFPFDISRIATGFVPARERFKGGFSFHLGRTLRMGENTSISIAPQSASSILTVGVH